MSMARPPLLRKRTFPAALAGLAVLTSSFCLTCCDKPRSPDQLLLNSGRDPSPRELARARNLFQNYCAICHGEGGKGDGQYFVSGLGATPSDLTRPGPQALDFDGLQKWIRVGSDGFGRSKLCPPWGHTLTDDDVTLLARFVLSLRTDKPLAEGSPHE